MILRLLLTCSLLALLGACGGGGGGNGVVRPDYPRLNNLTPTTEVSAVSTNAAFDNPTTQLESIPGGTVSISIGGDGSKITVVDVSVSQVGGTSFEQTFNQLEPVDGSGGTPPLFYATVIAQDGSVRSVFLANPAHALFDLNYMTLGFWEYEASGSAAAGVGGHFAAGIETLTDDIPVTGTASYSGGMIGRYADGSDAYAVSANASSQADFGARTVSLTTSNTFKVPVAGGSPVSDPSLNLSGSLSYAAGSNQLSSTASGITTAGGMSGSASAKFFGPGAQELGGTFFVSGSNQQMTGSFGLRR